MTTQGRGPLVGREREIGAATGALEGAASGRGRLLMLVGEPGIGKTSLADSIAATAEGRGFKVLWGRCWESGGAPAYWPWLDLLSELTAMLDDGALRHALGDGASLFGELVPEVRSRVPELGGEAAPPADEGRFRLWRATSALLNQVAKLQPLALVLDDLHAADRSSLALLHFVARQLRPMRIVLLGTYRDVEARMDAEASELLSRICREGATLPMARLDRGAAARFVRGRAGDVEAAVEARILDSAQGNPLFLNEMMNLHDEQGSAAIVAGEVPPGVREVIRQRLDRLAGEARSLLDLAAVAGDVIDLPLLVAASHRDAAWVSARLAEGARAGVVAGPTTGEVNPGGHAAQTGRRRFGHALFREVLYRELADETRRTLHGQMAEALERTSGTSPPHAEIAHHALEGPAAMLPRAVDHALRAADRAQELLAYDDAIRTLTRARDAVAAAGNPPALCARVLLATGEARIRRGEVEAGKADCREAATIARALDDAELAARAALTYGRVFTFGLVDPVLVDMIETSLAALPPGDGAWRARLLARLGGALQPSLKAEEPVRVAREAIEIARRLGDKSTLLETLHDGISALMDIVPAAEPRALNLEAERLAMELGDRERLLRTHGRLAVAHLALGAVEAADARIAAFEALASDLKAPWMGWRGGMLRAMRATMEGRFAEAERLAAEARRMGKAAGDPVVDTIWTTNREGLLRAAERHDELAAFEPDVCRARAALHLAPFWQSLQSILIGARLEKEDQVRLQMDLLPEGSLSALDNLFPTLFAAEGAALVGPRELAEGLYARIQGFSGECSVLGMSYMSFEGPWARLLGLLASYLGRWEAAWAYFEEARLLCRRLRARPYLARTEYEYGRALLARDGPGDRERARALLISARGAAVELGMPGLVRFTDARLIDAGIAKLGPGPTDHPAAGAVSAPAAPGPAPPELPFSFTLEGEYWTVRCKEITFRLKDSLGLQYLVRLFGDPGREIHVLDLAGERAGAAANEVVDTGDAGELLDEEARRSYKDRLEDLRETLAEAESFGDGARAERARAEMEMLAAELGRAVGLGGRVRRAGGAAERARSAVQRRIKNALERIGEHAPTLAAYLGRTVKTGNACIFRPDAG
jgi:hypothetical protein